MIPLQRKSVWYLTVHNTSSRDGTMFFKVSVGRIFWGSLWVSSWILFSLVKVTNSGGTTQQLSKFIWIASGLILAELCSSTNAWVSTSLTPKECAFSSSKTFSMAFHKTSLSFVLIPEGQEIKKRSAQVAPSSWRAKIVITCVLNHKIFYFNVIYLHLRQFSHILVEVWKGIAWQ